MAFNIKSFYINFKLKNNILPNMIRTTKRINKYFDFYIKLLGVSDWLRNAMDDGCSCGI